MDRQAEEHQREEHLAEERLKALQAEAERQNEAQGYALARAREDAAQVQRQNDDLRRDAQDKSVRMQ